MKPFESLQAVFTVPNLHQQLSAARPVQVYTYAFCSRAHARTSTGNAPSDDCGTLHVFQGARTLIPHNHEHHEIALVTAGSAIHRTVDGTRLLRRGAVLAVAPQDVHAFEEADHFRMVNCTYLTAYLFYDVREILSVGGLAPLFFRGTILSDGPHPRIPQWNMSEASLGACLYELHAIAVERRREDASPVLVRRTLEKLMLILHRTWTESDEFDATEIQPEVRTAIEHIEETIMQGQSFDASGIARRMGSSRDRFARLFRQVTGKTPTDYYQYRRVQQACCLLLNPGKTATVVAHDLGYYDSAHFCRLFQRYMGIGPQAFQKKYLFSDMPYRPEGQ